MSETQYSHIKHQIDQFDKTFIYLPKSYFPRYATLFEGTIIEDIIFNGNSFEEAASEYCRDRGWMEPA